MYILVNYYNNLYSIPCDIKEKLRLKIQQKVHDVRIDLDRTNFPIDSFAKLIT